ncbi:hypothetical protein QQ73_07620, partial [Candidatus Endoriftia persephone str. Guaymas]|nr:hypothetical protein [Candidatus Endoriftia persephone str. Guaymas]
ESTLAKSLANEAKLKEENASFSAAASHKAPIQDIAANIGAEVDAANRRLHDAQHGIHRCRVEARPDTEIAADPRELCRDRRLRRGADVGVAPPCIDRPRCSETRTSPVVSGSA